MALKEVDHRYVYELRSVEADHKVSVSVVGHVQHLHVVALMGSDQRPQEVPGVGDVAEEIRTAMGEEHGDMPRDG